MTETEKKALALLNEVGVFYHYPSLGSASMSDLRIALLRAIEQHEAFRQEVSDSLEHYLDQWRHSTPSREVFACQFGSFIIPKPDPLVEALNDMKDGRAGPTTESYAACLRAALAARGLEVRKIGEGE